MGSSVAVVVVVVEEGGGAGEEEGAVLRGIRCGEGVGARVKGAGWICCCCTGC